MKILSEDLNRIWLFSSGPHPVMFYYCLNSMDIQKKIFQYFLQVYLMEKQNEISFRDNIFLQLHQILKILDP